MDTLLREACAELCPYCDVLFHDAPATGCCGSCGEVSAYRALGSVKWLSDEAFSKLKIKYKWDDTYGFLDLNTGCKIPRIYRADICLTFLCADLRKKLGADKVRMLDKLISRILYDRYNCDLMKAIDKNAVLV